MTVLVTGAAGFIGYYVSHTLLERGEEVVGVDNLNPYYPVALKKARLSMLEGHKGFQFKQLDIADHEGFAGALAPHRFSHVVHLAAQAGVRHSLNAPFDYVQSNLVGHMTLLEFCRHHEGLAHLVYASSSSVYGGNKKVPFSEEDRVDQPVSLYAATKRSNEVLSHSYSVLYGIPQTGLRFFTVYGPWGRPDMAYWKFTNNILNGDPIDIYNEGDMWRDFTYIDDIVAGVIAAMDRPPKGAEPAPHRIYNLGNNKPEKLDHFVEVLEKHLGRQAEKRFLPMPPGDVYKTYADISAAARDLGYDPSTDLEEGLSHFVKWYEQNNNRF